MKLIVAITGASGVIYGIRLLEFLKKKEEISVSLVLSKVAKEIIQLETNYTLEYVKNLANKYYEEDDFTAPFISGSSKFNAMIIVPCSMKTLACIANGLSNNIITRAADCMMKEKKPLILVPRETPLNVIHLKNMLTLCKSGILILPASPAFYHKPKTIEELVNFIVGKILDHLNINNNLYKRWCD